MLSTLAAGLMMGAPVVAYPPKLDLAPIGDLAWQDVTTQGAPSAPSPLAAAPPADAGDDDVQDIVVTGEKGAPPGDPLEKLNAKSFEAVQSVDKAVVEPVAKAYNKGLPRPARKGLRNFFSNLQEPVVFAAYLLQFKPGKAAETAGRFAINSTLGFVGLFDVAKRKPFHLPYRPNGIANVLGFYGVGPGPYMYLPIVGPTTLRDIVGDTADKMILPLAVGKPFNKPAIVIPATILNQLGERAAFDERLQDIRASDDPYGTYRTLYLDQRKAEIDALHGRQPAETIVPVYGPGLPMTKGDAPQPPR
ncbi:phospholipid-binding lipoprotein MlaA [Sphingobium sp. OAS761]|uniref:MlaA family lipoprotein n=1 Tax=Sphingobium sp. OAS761 TaxID=2817901 RepID=UPI00209EF97D|nr:VacJ family lipoprotein [Sphingobium sp. OAS761]MCP1470565.1 phospholipid-binding lipoprotein MlaA [Sphingobium sp. OAS761]